MNYFQNITRYIKTIFWNLKIYRKESYAILVYKYNNLEPSSTIKAKIPIEFRILSLENLEGIYDTRYGNNNHFKERLLKGHIGTCAIHEGKVAAAVWAAKDEYFDQDLQIALSLPKGFLYAYDAYTSPEYRRLGIHQELSAESFREYLKMSYEFGLLFVSLKNEKGLLAAQKAGAENIGMIHSKIILGINQHKVETINKNNTALLSTIFYKIKIE